MCGTTSSGSAAAVADYQCHVAIGTQSVHFYLTACIHQQLTTSQHPSYDLLAIVESLGSYPRKNLIHIYAVTGL